jgi:hypothetical protein
MTTPIFAAVSDASRLPIETHGRNLERERERRKMRPGYVLPVHYILPYMHHTQNGLPRVFCTDTCVQQHGCTYKID